MFKRIISLSRKKIVAPNFNISFQCHSFDGSGTEMIFSQNLFRRPTPTCIVCRNWESNFSLLGPIPNLHIIVS
ncbi:hypothetical protein SAST40_04425 [Staphylococcus aureus]|nr:hypothetical protein SAST40_04425 [Staphylococcus aureus]AMV79867.1 hypothetical protein SAST41_04201 [Staphylococcus aureus]